MVAGVAGGLIAGSVSNRPSEDRVAAMIEERMLVQQGSQDLSSSLGASIESYLLENPTILERVSLALNQQRTMEQLAANRKIIEANRDIIFGGTDTVVVGNPEGDVTLVEFYDYNCEYCRRAFPDVVALIDSDPDLRVVLRQFPILSQGSVDAAKVGILVDNAGADYWSFHQSMFTARGQVDLAFAIKEAVALGLDEAALQAGIQDPALSAALQESYDLAGQLGISGTPTFILGDEIIPGAVGLEVLRQKIANVRACGSTICETGAATDNIVLPPPALTEVQ